MAATPPPREELVGLPPIVPQLGPYSLSDSGDINTAATNGAALHVFVAPYKCAVYGIDLYVEVAAQLDGTDYLIATPYKLSTSQIASGLAATTPAGTQMGAATNVTATGVTKMTLGGDSAANDTALWLEEGEKLAILFDESTIDLDITSMYVSALISPIVM